MDVEIIDCLHGISSVICRKSFRYSKVFQLMQCTHHLRPHVSAHHLASGYGKPQILMDWRGSVVVLALG